MTPEQSSHPRKFEKCSDASLPCQLQVMIDHAQWQDKEIARLKAEVQAAHLAGFHEGRDAAATALDNRRKQMNTDSLYHGRSELRIMAEAIRALEPKP